MLLPILRSGSLDSTVATAFCLAASLRTTPPRKASLTYQEHLGGERAAVEDEIKDRNKQIEAPAKRIESLIHPQNFVDCPSFVTASRCRSPGRACVVRT